MIAFLFLIIILCCIAFFKHNNFNLFNKFDKLLVVTNNKFSQNYDYIENGNQIYYSFNNEEGLEFLDYNLSDKNIVGLTFYFYEEKFNINEFKNAVNFITSESNDLENYKIYYGYYNGFKKFEMINGKKINFQLVFHNKTYILGFPMILNGF